jgi:hypothetical protein
MPDEYRNGTNVTCVITFFGWKSSLHHHLIKQSNQHHLSAARSEDELSTGIIQQACYEKPQDYVNPPHGSIYP